MDLPFVVDSLVPPFKHTSGWEAMEGVPEAHGHLGVERTGGPIRTEGVEHTGGPIRTGGVGSGPPGIERRANPLAAERACLVRGGTSLVT